MQLSLQMTVKLLLFKEAAEEEGKEHTAAYSKEKKPKTGTS